MPVFDEIPSKKQLPCLQWEHLCQLIFGQVLVTAIDVSKPIVTVFRFQQISVYDCHEPLLIQIYQYFTLFKGMSIFYR